MEYPYLGERFIAGQKVVVMFTEENEGTVVMSNIDFMDEYRFGRHGKFNEDDFDFFPADSCVRINN